MNTEILQKACFTANEADILICLYTYGVQSAQQVAEQLKISKSSSLFVLKQLVEKGYVEKRSRYNTFLFQAKSPDIILRKIEKEIIKLEKRKEELEPLVDDLKRLRDYESGKKVFYYDNETAIKRLRSGLIDAAQIGTAKRTFNELTNVEKFEADRYVFLLSTKNNFAIRIEPKQDFEKLEKLFNDYLKK